MERTGNEGWEMQVLKNLGRKEGMESSGEGEKKSKKNDYVGCEEGRKEIRGYKEVQKKQ